MVVGVVYQGRCIPLAWHVYHANSKADYPAEGQVEMVLRLLDHVAAACRAGQPCVCWPTVALARRRH